MRGFSLVELVLVVLIIAIMAAVAVPRFAASATRNRVDAAANRLAADFRLAQRAARLSSASRSISVVVDADAYRLPELAGLDRATDQYEVRLGDPPYEVQIIQIDLGGDAVLTFDGYGVPDSKGEIVIQAGSEQRTIQVAAETGEVSISGTPVAVAPAPAPAPQGEGNPPAEEDPPEEGDPPAEEQPGGEGSGEGSGDSPKVTDLLPGGKMGG